MKFMRICWCELCGKTKGTLEKFQWDSLIMTKCSDHMPTNYSKSRELP